MAPASATIGVRSFLVIASIGASQKPDEPQDMRDRRCTNNPNMRAGIYEHRSLAGIWQESDANQIALLILLGYQPINATLARLNAPLIR